MSQSEHRGAVYYAYTHFGLQSDSTYGDIRLSILQPGDSVFSSWITLADSTLGYLSHGVNMIVSPSGELHVVWGRRDASGPNVDESAIGFATLAPGATQYVKSPDSIHGLGVVGYRQLDLKPSPNNTKSNSFPVIAMDTSGGPFDGSLYVVWNDGRNGRPDIYITKRRNGNANWEAPIRVNDDLTETDQWMPWMTVDPQGRIHVVFYDSRIDPASNLETAVYMATSSDGGITFTNYLVSDSSFEPSPVENGGTSYAGDYIGIASNGCLAFPCWNDNRTGAHQAYIARVPTNQIWADSTWATPVNLDRDLWIAPGATLTVDAGTIVSVVPDCDSCALGSDDLKSEIIVEGTLILNGTAGNPIAIESSTGGGKDDWYGIRVVDSGRVIMDNAIIKNAYAGISFESGDATGSIDSCVIESCLVYGVYTVAPGIPIHGSTFRDIDGYGIRSASAGLDVVRDSFYNCDYGIYRTGLSIGSDSIFDCDFSRWQDSSMIAGIYTTAAPLIKQCGFKGGFQTAAVYVGPAIAARPYIYSCAFEGIGLGATGLYADQGSRPTVRCSRFTNYRMRDVYCYKSLTEPRTRHRFSSIRQEPAHAADRQ